MYNLIQHSVPHHMVRRMLVTQRPSAAAAVMLSGGKKRGKVSHGIFSSPQLESGPMHACSDSGGIYTRTNEIGSGIRDVCMRREGDPYTAAEGAEGAAADVAVGGLLERRRRLHGPTAPAACSGSGPELACLASAIYGGGDGENRRPTR
jgi:hypothetical protein